MIGGKYDAFEVSAFLFFFISFSSVSSSSPTSINADRYLLKVLRRARNRFVQYRHSSNNGMIDGNRIPVDNQSDSGVFTSSSRTNFNDDFESNSLLDTDEDHLQSMNTDDPNNELLCQSLEAVLMEALIEIRQHRQQQRSNNYNTNVSIKHKEQSLITRL